MNTQPQTGDGRTKGRWRRRVVRLCLVCFLAGVFCLAALKMLTIYKAHKIKAIANALQTLTPEVSSREQAELIAKRFGRRTDLFEQPCTQDTCTLGWRVQWFDPPFVGKNRLWDEIVAQSYPLFENQYFNAIGIHMWYSQAWIHLKGNTVSSFGLHVYVQGPNRGWTDAGWSLSKNLPQELLSLYDTNNLPRPRHYLTRWHHLHMGPRETGQGLDAYVSVQARAEYIRHAQNLNLTCLTKWGGCSSLHDLYPEAARDNDRFVACRSEHRGEGGFLCE